MVFVNINMSFRFMEGRLNLGLGVGYGFSMTCVVAASGPRLGAVYRAGAAEKQTSK
jgi:hypothetical protein